MVKVYKDQENVLRMNSDESWGNVVSGFFEQDVQSSSEYVEMLIEHSNHAKQDSDYSWSGTGNAHTISFENGIVVIENEYDDSSFCELTREQFGEVLQLWKTAILS